MSRRHRDGSKWTRLDPVGRDRHFVIVGAIRPPRQSDPWRYQLRAVLSGKVYSIDGLELGDVARWAPGWTRT